MTTVFVLPFLFMTCFHYQMHDGEVMWAWHIKQPTVIEISDGVRGEIRGGIFEGRCDAASFFIHLNNGIR